MTNKNDQSSARKPRLTIFTKNDGILTKKLSIDAEGSLQKASSQCFLDKGNCKTVEFDDLNKLNKGLDLLPPYMAVAYGITDKSSLRLVVSKKLKSQHPDAITRTNDNFAYPSSAICMLDYDPEPNCEPLSADKLYKLLIEAMPELATVDILWRPSASSCIFNGEEEIIGISGQRFYFIVDRGEMIPKIGEMIAKRLWLNGQGRIDLSKSGSMLVRCPVDTCVWQPERLDFASGAFCLPPLERRPVPGKVYEGVRHD